MVLEESSTPQEPFTENVPTSDLDPYAGSFAPIIEGREPGYFLISPPGTPKPVWINLDKLPQRFPLIGRPSHTSAMLKTLRQTCDVGQNVLGRPLTQEEGDAFSFHVAKCFRTMSLNPAMGLIIGGALAMRGSDRLRFPGGWRPKEGGWFSPDRFWSLRGESARIAWGTTRMVAYLVVASMITQAVVGSYALTVMSTGQALDPRLKEYGQAVRQKVREGHTARELSQFGKQGDAPSRQETFEMARQRRAAQDVMGSRQTEKRQAPQSRSVQDDDMSPTGGAFEEDLAGGMWDDRQAPTPQYQSQPRQQTTSSPAQSSDSFSDYYGGAAQPARPGVETRSAPQPPRQPTGSAWERLRQGAMSGDQGSSSSSSMGSHTREPGSQRSPTDSFTFSSKDENRELAKADAQKDFDARIEREREGKDFDDRGRWRR